MKLITKTSRYYFYFTIPVLLISALISYFFMLEEIGESNKTILNSRIKVIENHLKNKDTLLLNIYKENIEIEVAEIDINKRIQSVISDTIIFSDFEKEYVSYNSLEKNSIINSTNYRIKVWKSSIELYEVFEVIFLIFFLILLFLIISIVIINIKISKIIWQPFLDTLNKIKSFNITKNEVIEFKKTNITEFEELNKSIAIMTRKMITDYGNQKRFTENASHEIQTPLAIIKSKIELLIQSTSLQKNELELINSIDEATDRLSKLNKSLLLLSKIQNNQFNTKNAITIYPILENSIQQNSSFLQHKNIRLTNSVPPNYKLKINDEMAFVLFNNLIQNAIRHNIYNGKIIIEVSNSDFYIYNTGIETVLNKNIIFERFEKNSSNPNSIGLGLAIVKEIATANNLKINYFFKDKMHGFKINKNKK